MSKAYNSRFTRPDNPLVMRLTPRDIDMVRLAGQFRFIDTNHFHAFHQSSLVNLRHRLKLLWANGYLDRPRIQIDYYMRGGGSRPMIYALSDKGAKLLHEVDGFSQRPRVSWKRKNHEIKHPQMQHELMTTDFAVMLHKASAKSSHVRLYDDTDLLYRLPDDTAKKQKPFKLSTRLILPTGIEDVTLEPDYVFSLEWRDLDKSGNFFCEIDRGTMPVERHDFRHSSILRKLAAYQNYWKSKDHNKDFKWLNFRVLFITNNAKRADNMREAMQNYPGTRNSPLFWFTSLEEIKGDVLTHEFFDQGSKAQTLTPA